MKNERSMKRNLIKAMQSYGEMLGCIGHI